MRLLRYLPMWVIRNSTIRHITVMVWRTLLQCTKKQYCIKTWHQNHLKRGTWPGDLSKSAPKRPKSVSAGANPWDGGPPRPGTISARREIQKNKYERNTKIQTYKIQLWTTQALDQKYKKTNIKYVSIHSYTKNMRKYKHIKYNGRPPSERADT